MGKRSNVIGLVLAIIGSLFSTISFTLFRGTRLYYILAIIALAIILCGLIVIVVGYVKKK